MTTDETRRPCVLCDCTGCRRCNNFLKSCERIPGREVRDGQGGAT